MASSPTFPPSPLELESKPALSAGAITMLPRRAAHTAAVPPCAAALGAVPSMNGSAGSGPASDTASASSTSVSALATNPGFTTGTTASSSAMPSPPELDDAGTSSTTDRATSASASTGLGASLSAASAPVSAHRTRASVSSSSSLSLVDKAKPQTGAGKMAAAAAAGLKRSDDDAPPEEHPLSDRRLTARDYHTLHAMQHLFHLPNRWRLLRPLGQGAYGLVISVQDSVSGEPVAVKCITRVFDKPILAKRALREITLLRHFGEHENLTGLIDLDNVWSGYNEIYLYMEPMEADLHQIVRSGQPLSNLHIQFFIYQLLRGMKYIHSANVIHRDLKPGNLLVNADCELKICDFGLARGFRPVPGEAGMHEGLKLTEYVATRWYRAPEIMLSNKRYTTAMDVWSIGCILGELLGGKPMFKGKDYVDQLNLILGILGTPDDETLESMSSEKARMYVRTLRYSEPVPLATMLPDADPQALDLLGQLLAFDPTKRIDVVTALDHPYVAAYHDLDDEPECEVFDKWEEVEKLQTLDELREALTNEITEYRAEVRGLAQMELEEGIANGEYTYAYEDEDGEEVDVDVEVAEPAEIEVEPELLPEDQVTSPSRHGRPAIVDTTNVPDSPCERTGSPVRTKLGLAAAAGRSPTLSPRRPRQSSPYAPRTPRTPRTPGEEGARTRHTRRSSSQSAHRRSMSFLFGSGLAMSSLAMTPAAGAPGSGAITSGESTATAGTAGTAGAMTGPRSRAPSAAGADFSSLGPIIRQLSTTNLADMGNALTDDEPLMTEGSDDGHIVIGRGRRGSRPRGPE